MNKKNIGIREIAKQAGVSVATVSRVINGTGNTSDEVNERVNKVVKEFNYIPNIVAKSMYSSTSNSIALFVLDLDNPFFISVIKELNAIAIKNGYTLLICDTENSPERENEYLNYCKGIRTKGIIFTEGYRSNLLNGDFENQNLVFHDRFISSAFSTVMSNNEKGIRILVDYLYNLNHRKIGYAGWLPSIKSSVERKDAFHEALKDKKIITPDEYIFQCNLTIEAGVQAIDYFCSLPNRPTAIVCGNDQIAKGFITRAHMLNIKIPEDFSVVGFDGCNQDYFYPRITTIKQDIKSIAQNLFECVTSETGEARLHIVDVSMIIGESCRRIKL
ncbi:MAG: LacI family DNA-binding transcriptional regulator [Oscillospiraceae bacterium]